MVSHFKRGLISHFTPFDFLLEAETLIHQRQPFKSILDTTKYQAKLSSLSQGNAKCHQLIANHCKIVFNFKNQEVEFEAAEQWSLDRSILVA